MFKLSHRVNKPISLSRSILDVMPIPVAIFDVDCKLLHANMTFSQWFILNSFGLESLEHTLNIINELMSDELEMILSEVMTNEESNYIKEIVIRTKISPHKTCKTSFANIYCNNKSHGVIMFFEDKDHEIENIALYKEQAQLDQLTNTLNRFGFYEAFNRVTHQSINHKFIYAVMIVDIDKLKLLNDLKGHQYGDLVIQNTAQGLLKELRTEDILARWGGDEFIIVLTNIFSLNHVKKLSQRLAMSVAEYNVDQKTSSSISYGLAVWKTHGETLDDLIGFADKMMYEQKNNK
ncbi:sensor domain-containing diguanylate cyclase [Colwellia sp. 12G3]|uniref:sensor domain-containing diguanylate cyclase n=1 Tax=Colwellia sp. 12G3 TaxID=2058299 RepID=UPI0012FEBAA4|nr:GGDEF domain-containing protein [Colwellia sp. 12G3]